MSNTMNNAGESDRNQYACSNRDWILTGQLVLIWLKENRMSFEANIVRNVAKEAIMRVELGIRRNSSGPPLDLDDSEQSIQRLTTVFLESDWDRVEVLIGDDEDKRETLLNDLERRERECEGIDGALKVFDTIRDDVLQAIQRCDMREYGVLVEAAGLAARFAYEIRAERSRQSPDEIE